ncbi:hypothetical protein B0J11DRAFT_445447 [Dendryphion nanum]|uniref:Allergen n=1 Tax=Dendryphion nanum TaxID=256645 RepID=A0A9P9IBZ3_9PLEO|nr:hypothetical protein B0J11DRAFT_445447 [Dendryphion nanum]
MDKAKAAITDFMHKSGHKDTTVHETVAPAVQHEVVKPHQHEEILTAVDKEVHQDHYHRTVQPVQDREVLPEKHTAQLGAVQHREFDHRDHDQVKRALHTEQSGFKDERVVDGTTHSQSAAAAVAGEHVHHHIHETIQPVIHKETIQPNVVHTTVPIHETHHNAAVHHGASTLPAVSLDEFKSRGGVLGGREERYDAFEGEPKNIGGAVAAGLNHRRDDSHHGERDVLDGVDRKSTSSSNYSGLEHGNGAGARNGSGLKNGHEKPGLMDKLNPKTDADHDGKRGILN